MKTLALALCATVVGLSAVGDASARDDRDGTYKSRKYRASQRAEIRYSQPRYDQSSYYERDSRVLPVGSRQWWDQLGRERGGRR